MAGPSNLEIQINQFLLETENEEEVLGGVSSDENDDENDAISDHDSHTEQSAESDEEDDAMDVSNEDCEQYSKLVCEGVEDLCSWRVLDESTAVPGEYPHQALLGVQTPTLRLFHCGGSLVSKQFILSAAECQTYLRYETTIALVGEYDMYEYQEFGQKEQLTYISQVFEEPYDAKSLMALFRLWRPVKLHYLVKPVCLDWRVNWREGVFLGAKVPKTLMFSGYGASHTDGRWNRTVKRHLVEAVTTIDIYDGWGKCTEPYSFCDKPSGSDIPWGPCEFDLGAPASTRDRDQAPYCQWKVYGVSVTPRQDCNDTTESAFRETLSALAWMEDVIWSFDMNLFSFDTSFPKCHNKIEDTFTRLIHCKSWWENNRGYYGHCCDD